MTLKTYKFARVCCGVCVFAEATVSTEPSARPLHDYPEWVDAAYRGIEEARAALDITQNLVHLVAIRGVVSDTDPNAMRIAAFMATVCLFDRGDAFEPACLESGGWTIQRS